jgi:hypothetical protein
VTCTTLIHPSSGSSGVFESLYVLRTTYNYYPQTGIGDKNVLDAHGIDVKLDLPGVGANLEPIFFRVHFLYRAIFSDLIPDL